MFCFIGYGLYVSFFGKNSYPFSHEGYFYSDMLKPAFWVALIFVSYAYSGWNATSYMIDDIEQPKKNVPRSILIGTSIVLVIYVLINYVFLVSAPASEMKGREDVAHVAASYLFGSKGALLISFLISFFLISTISSMIMVGPRVIKRISMDYSEFSFFSKENKNGIPVRAILFQSFIAIIVLLTSSFEFIITCIGFVLCLFTTLTAISLIVLRKKYPDTERSIKVPFYPFTPILFCIFNIWTMSYLLVSRTSEVIAGISFVLLGSIFYLFLKKKKVSSSLVSILLFSIIFFSCNNAPHKEEPIANKTIDSKIIKSHRPPDTDCLLKAAFYADLNKVNYDSLPGKFVNNLKSSLDSKSKNLLNPIRKWMTAEKMDSIIGNHYSVFYPFSGPDFAFVNSFFPDAELYILAGLEKAGIRDSLINSDSKKVLSFFKNADHYFRFSNKFGFYRTLDMEKQFDTTGVVNIIVLELCQSGAVIEDIEFLTWNAAGGTLINTPSNKMADVCHFRFQLPSGRESELYYFSKNLLDGALKKDSLWLDWVSDKSKGSKLVSLVKSASYLLHTQIFTQVRQFILDSSKFHIQDDTGLRFQLMKESGHHVICYGKYNRVIPVFRKYIQADLKSVYSTDSIKPLPFNIGYNAVYNEPNIQVMY